MFHLFWCLLSIKTFEYIYQEYWFLLALAAASAVIVAVVERTFLKEKHLVHRMAQENTPLGSLFSVGPSLGWITVWIYIKLVLWASL